MTSSYDDGYAACPCFWGREPGSFVLELAAHVPSVVGLRVLDVGCGEGKNAVFFADRGAYVRAVDASALAIRNARNAWPDAQNVTWEIADVRDLAIQPDSFDIVVAYGLLHCLRDSAEVHTTVRSLQAATVAGGFNVICAFNDRSQDLSAHPGFSPTLLSHDDYELLYRDWLVPRVSDTDLHESHPHNNIPHRHSMTRLVAQKP